MSGLGSRLILLALAAVGTAAAADLEKDPVARDRAVRDALGGESLTYTETLAARSAGGPVLVAYVQASAWDGFVRVVPDASGWKVDWQARMPFQGDEPSWLQVSSGWTLQDADGDGAPDAVYLGCLPHFCCGEFGIAVVSLGSAGGWVVHLESDGRDKIELRQEAGAPLPESLRPYLRSQIVQNLCDRSESLERQVASALDALSKNR
jgi:hypothetical protein